MAILTPLPPTPGPKSATSPFTPDTPPHLADPTFTPSSNTNEAEEECADLLDLTFVDDDASAVDPSSPTHPTTALTKYTSWAPLIPDGIKSKVLAEEGGKKEAKAGLNPSDVSGTFESPEQIAPATVSPREEGRRLVLEHDTATDNSPSDISGDQTVRISPTATSPTLLPAAETSQRRSSSLNGAAPSFDACAIRSPSVFYSTASDVSEPTQPPIQSAPSALNAEDTAQWAMQQGFGGFGHIPLPAPSTPAPMPSRYTTSYHTMPTSTPIRITSPPQKTAQTAPSSLVKIDRAQAGSTEAGQVSPLHTPAEASAPILEAPATPVKRATTPLTGSTTTVSDFSLRPPLPSHETSTPCPVPNDAQAAILQGSSVQEDLTQRSWAQGITEIGNLDTRWTELREAFGRFGGSMDEVSERLRSIMSSHVCHAEGGSSDELSETRISLVRLQDQLATAQEALSEVTIRHDDMQKAKAEADTKLQQAEAEAKHAMLLAEEARSREDVWRSRIDSVRASNDSLLADQQYWHKRERELAKGFIALENDYIALVDKYKALKKNGNLTRREPFAVALLDVSSNLIDPELLQKGEAGGKILANDIAERVKASAATKIDTVLIQLFLDFPKLSNALKDDRIIRKESQLHDFLDGFRAVSTLNTVNDCPNPSRILGDHAKLHVRMGATTVLIGSRQNEELVETMRQADKPSNVMRFIQTRRAVEKDQWAAIDASRIVQLPNITPGNNAVHSRQSSVSDVSDSYTELVTPVPPKRSLRERIADALVTPSDSISSVGQIEETPYIAASEQRPAPWQRSDRRPALRANHPSPPRAKTPVPYWEQGTTLLDAHLAEEALKEFGGQATPRAATYSVISSPTPRKSTGLSIPVDGDEGSLAGSPPDSDEDTPSVPLPHSAVKHVQRPTPVQLRSASSSEVSSNAKGNAPHRNEPAKAHKQKASRMASTTGSNNTPLGSMRSKGADDKVHGFKVHGRKPWSERRDL